MRRSLTVAVMAAATLLAGGATATASASESPSPTTSPSSSSGSSPDAATPLERVSAYTGPSVVAINIEWTGYIWDKYNKAYLNNGTPFTLNWGCTGYVVTPDGYIATAGHCVNGDDAKDQLILTAADWAANNGYYQTEGLTVEDILGFDNYQVQDEEGKTKPNLKVTTSWAESAGGVETGKALPARVVKWQSFDKGDGAIVKVEANNLNALPLDEDPVEIGNEVVAVGYPGSVDAVVDDNWTPSYKEGSISSKKTMGDGLLTVYEISAATSGGMSGGPVVNLDGEVVGFVDFDPGVEETEPFNFIRPASTIRELLGDAGTSNELSEDSQAYRAGLDAYFGGDKVTAVEQLTSVVENQPTNESAKEFLDKAKDLPDPVKEETSKDGGSSLGLIIGIVVAVLVLLVVIGGVLMAMARKKKGPSASTGSAQYGSYPQVPGPGGSGGTLRPSGATVLTPSAIQSAPSTTEAPTAVAAPAADSAPTSATGTASATSATMAPPSPGGVAEAETDETVFCSNCGTRGEPGQKFCKHCGTGL